MLFRPQHAWLLLASIFSFTTFLFPFYHGITTRNNISEPIIIQASSHPGTFILSASLLVGSLIVIFLNKDLHIQLVLTAGLLLISLLNIIIYFRFISHFQDSSGALSFSAVFSFLIPLCIFIAARKIRQDEKFGTMSKKSAGLLNEK